MVPAWPTEGIFLSEDQSLDLCPALKWVGSILGMGSGQKAENQGQNILDVRI